ncbi:MAG: flagellar biosynthesis protein FlhF [Chromatiales bacterium]|jgi:flagellar biosynthesis protein FlhF
MKIKRFFASDMRQAIRQVRQDQGPDAVILSSRQVDGGVEIISAMDFDQTAITRMSGEPARGGPDALATADEPELAETYAPMRAPTAPSDTAKPDVVWSQDPAIVEMRRELQSMRDMLQGQMTQLAWGDLARREPARAQVIRRLGKLGFAPRLAKDVAARVTKTGDVEEAWREALYLMAQQIPVAGEDLVGEGGMIALVGPTGVGKTTTAAKLAARAALRHGRRQVAMVTADSYRIGAHKQLLTFGQILGVEVHAASSRAELGEILKSLLDKKLVLIDTAGMSQRDMRLSEQFGALTSVPLIKTFLVASVTAQRSVFEEVVRAFGRVRLDGCILTKLDEAASLGDALSVVASAQLPISYLSDGQRVPEDLHPARVSRLISRAVALARAQDKVEASTSGPSTASLGGIDANAHV